MADDGWGAERRSDDEQVSIESLDGRSRYSLLVRLSLRHFDGDGGMMDADAGGDASISKH